jgi:hypothetical protein
MPGIGGRRRIGQLPSPVEGHGTRCSRPHVKLGFDVDADVPVHRLEVWERINASG